MDSGRFARLASWFLLAWVTARAMRSHFDVGEVQPTSTDEAPPNGPAPAPRWSKYLLRALTPAVLAAVTATTAWYGLVLYNRFEDAKAFPTPPVSSSKIALFFEEQDADVTVSVYAEKNGYFSITAENSSPGGRSSTFLTIYSGDGGSLQQDSGRRQFADSATVGPHPITAVHDRRQRTIAELNEASGYLGLHRPTDDDSGVYPQSFRIDGYNPDARVVATALGRVRERGSESSLDGFPYGNWGSVVTVAAGREAGSLPTVSAPREVIALPYASLGGGGSQSVGSIVARGNQRWYPPKSITIETYVNYTGAEIRRHAAAPEDLPINYRITRTRPQTIADSQLLWEQSDTAQVNWLVENQEQLNSSQDDLFLAGIFLGGSLGFLASTVERILDLLPLGRRRRADTSS